MAQEKIQIKLKNGLQSRQAAFFVQEANRFSSEIFIVIEKGNQKLNAKSIIGVMSLAAKFGDTIIISAHGFDEMEAIEYLKHLIIQDEMY